MSDSFVPTELKQRCFALVQRHHAANGFGDLADRITTNQHMVLLATIPEMMTIIRSISAAHRMRMLCWVIDIAIAIAALAYSWWILLGLAVLIVVDRRLAAHDRGSWMILAANLLALDMLSNDFAGWGAARPNHAEQARTMLGSNGGSNATYWLDYYLPRRMELEPALVRAFGPEV